MKILRCCKETHGSVAAQLEETQPLRRSDKASKISMKLPLAKLPLNYMEGKINFMYYLTSQAPKKSRMQ